MTIAELRALIKKYQPSLMSSLFCCRRSQPLVLKLIDFVNSLPKQDQNVELTEDQRLQMCEIIRKYPEHNLYDELVKKMGSSYSGMLQILENELFIDSEENRTLLFKLTPAQVAKLDKIFQRAIYANDVRCGDDRPFNEKERKDLFEKTISYIDDAQFTQSLDDGRNRLTLVDIQQLVEDCEGDKAANLLMSLASNDSDYGPLDTVRLVQTYLTTKKELKSLPTQPRVRNLR